MEQLHFDLVQSHRQHPMEIIVDFRRDKCVHVPLCIKEEQVNIVKKYKYLGVYIDDQLSFSENIHTVYCKCLQRLRYLQELASQLEG